MLKILWIVLLLIITNQSHARSKCQTEWEALKYVQSQLRNNSTEYLRKKEHQRHEIYQACRSNENNKSSGNSVYSKKKSTQKTYYRNGYARNSFKNSAINITTKFSGQKQIAWVNSYKTPKECIKPKSTSKFASCLNHRDIEAKKFSVKWNKQNQ